jgi:hypothetical protein
LHDRIFNKSYEPTICHVAISITIFITISKTISISILVVYLRDNKPGLAASNCTQLDYSNRPGMKKIDQELAKQAGVDSFIESMKCHGNIAVEVGELRNTE